jgi:hypothetical protein
MPAAAAIGRASSSDEGSSTASRRAPRRAATAISSVTAWAKPLQISTVSGPAAVPRTRLR